MDCLSGCYASFNWVKLALGLCLEAFEPLRTCGLCREALWRSMTLSTQLQSRAGSVCELCAAPNAATALPVEPRESESADTTVLACEPCAAQIESGALHSDHFRVLKDTMWSQEPPVQAMIYRLLTQLSAESWANEARDMLYLEPEIIDWAMAGITEQSAPTRDSHGTILNSGDTVTLIKDLPVKGAGFTAKRGTAVRGISLTNNPEHIEGRVNGQRIVLVTAYLKKS